MPPTVPEPDAVDQMMFESVGSGVAHPLSTAGFGKDDVRRYMREHATIPASLMENFARQTGGLELDFKQLVADG